MTFSLKKLTQAFKAAVLVGISSGANAFQDEMKYGVDLDFVPMPYEQQLVKKLHDLKHYTSEQDVIKNYQELVQTVKDHLIEKKHFMALSCFELLLEMTPQKNKRQDGVSPESLHALTQAIWHINDVEHGVNFDDPELTTALAFIHDLGEDYKVTPPLLKGYLKRRGHEENERMQELLEGFHAISKKYSHRGREKSLKKPDRTKDRYKNEFEYYVTLQHNRLASQAKLYDRIHNIVTLIGPKTLPAVSRYISKTLQLQNDYIKNSVENFPDQAAFYRSAEHMIHSASQTSRYMISMTGKKITNDDDFMKAMPSRGFENLPDGLNPLKIIAERIRAEYERDPQLLASLTESEADVDVAGYRRYTDEDFADDPENEAAFWDVVDCISKVHPAQVQGDNPELIV